MSQTKYKLENNKRSIVVHYCRLYKDYKNSKDENQQRTAKIIENNKLMIGLDIASKTVRTKLIKAIWHSTCNAKKYPYEVWDLPAISRNEFYERKRKFIYYIANDLKI